MSNFEKNKVTGNGHALLSKVLSGKCRLHFTRIQAGDGYFDGDVMQLSELVNFRLEGRITNVREMGIFTEVSVIITNQNLTEFMEFREVGLWATGILKDGTYHPELGENGILFAYANARNNPSPIGPFNGVWLHEEDFTMRVFTANATNITGEIVLSAFASEVAFDNTGMSLSADNMQSAIEELSEGITTSNKEMQVLHDTVNTNITTLTQNITTRMPHAPLTAVHGAMGSRWIELEGVAIQAVVMAFEDIPIKGTIPQSAVTGHVIEIEEDIFARSKAFNPIVNGATVRIPKDLSEPKQTLYAVGADLKYYSFDYDGENRTITVKCLDVLASSFNILHSNPNILHNWDMRNPVNQRGQLVYTGAGIFYTIDRWHSYLTDVALTNEGLQLTNQASRLSALAQRIEFPELHLGKTYTLSAICDNELISFIVTLPKYLQNITFGEIHTSWGRFLINSNGRTVAVQFILNPGASVIIQAAKLELGTVSTLANDPPMDFGRELLTCSRYFLITSIFDPGKIISNANSGTFTTTIRLPAFMRINPRITFPEQTALRVFCNGRILPLRHLNSTIIMRNKHLLQINIPLESPAPELNAHAAFVSHEVSRLFVAYLDANL